ncbi:MAG TPA: hypothetical protein VFK57_13050 [Vicinamibacterales bacterium]|nr:hypothetical protein [Vicinamibacterales bacterium]
MGSSFTAVVFIGAALLLGGCSQGAAPAGPTSVASAGASLTSSPPAVAAAATPRVPLTGTMRGTDVDSDPTPTTIVVTTEGGGTATHLGQFSFTERVTLTFATLTAVGTSHWVAANGDSFDTTIEASGQPTGTPGEFSITDIHTITGGTGRFAGAHGRFIVERVASAITLTTSGSFAGTISLPAAAD